MIRQLIASLMLLVVAVFVVKKTVRRVSNALTYTQNWNRQIIDASHDAVVGMDAHGNITDWNREAETLFGWSREEALAKKMADTIISAEYRGAHDIELERVLETSEGPYMNNNFEITALHRDGHNFRLKSQSPLFNRMTSGFAFGKRPNGRKWKPKLLRRKTERNPQRVPSPTSWQE